MRITAIGEGQQMKRTIPLLMLHGFDTSYFSRCKQITDNLLHPPIPQTALPQALEESQCILFFINNDSVKKYPLGRDAKAAIANKTVITLFDEFSDLDQFEQNMTNLRVDYMSIKYSEQQLEIFARTEQHQQWAALLDALQIHRVPRHLNITNDKNVIAGPWEYSVHPAVNPVTAARKQPMN